MIAVSKNFRQDLIKNIKKTIRAFKLCPPFQRKSMALDVMTVIFGPIYKGFSSFPSRAWDFAMGNLIRDWSSCQPGQMHQKKQQNIAMGHDTHVHVLMYVLFFFTSLQLLHTNWEHHIKEYKSADEWLPPRCWLAEFFAAANDSKTKRNTGDLQIESKNPLFFMVFDRDWKAL